jgi:EamA domain-containing membrane protein RarD
VLPGAVVLCYGILLALAATHVFGGIAGFVAGLAGLHGKEFVQTVMLTTLPLQVVSFYLIARWIGVRSRANGIWLVLIVFTVVSTADNVIRLLFLPPATYANR